MAILFVELKATTDNLMTAKMPGGVSLNAFRAENQLALA
jgi:hypothetical protein